MGVSHQGSHTKGATVISINIPDEPHEWQPKHHITKNTGEHSAEAETGPYTTDKGDLSVIFLEAKVDLTCPQPPTPTEPKQHPLLLWTGFDPLWDGPIARAVSALWNILRDRQAHDRNTVINTVLNQHPRLQRATVAHIIYSLRKRGLIWKPSKNELQLTELAQ